MTPLRHRMVGSGGGFEVFKILHPVQFLSLGLWIRR